MLTRLLAVIALVAGAATVSYLAAGASARGADQPSLGYLSGYASGMVDGREQGSREVARRYAAGAPGYAAIFAAGRRAGYRAGLDDGLARGSQQGYRAALAAVGGGWRPHHWYVVRFDPGPGPGGVRVTARVQVAPTRVYGVCAGSPDAVCAGPLPRSW